MSLSAPTTPRREGGRSWKVQRETGLRTRAQGSESTILPLMKKVSSDRRIRVIVALLVRLADHVEVVLRDGRRFPDSDAENRKNPPTSGKTHALARRPLTT